MAPKKPRVDFTLDEEKILFLTVEKYMKDHPRSQQKCWATIHKLSNLKRHTQQACRDKWHNSRKKGKSITSYKSLMASRSQHEDQDGYAESDGEDLLQEHSTGPIGGANSNRDQRPSLTVGTENRNRSMELQKALTLIEPLVGSHMFLYCNQMHEYLDSDKRFTFLEYGLEVDQFVEGLTFTKRARLFGRRANMFEGEDNDMAKVMRAFGLRFDWSSFGTAQGHMGNGNTGTFIAATAGPSKRTHGTVEEPVFAESLSASRAAMSRDDDASDEAMDLSVETEGLDLEDEGSVAEAELENRQSNEIYIRVKKMPEDTMNLSRGYAAAFPNRKLTYGDWKEILSINKTKNPARYRSAEWLEYAHNAGLSLHRQISGKKIKLEFFSTVVPNLDQCINKGIQLQPLKMEPGRFSLMTIFHCLDNANLSTLRGGIQNLVTKRMLSVMPGMDSWEKRFLDKLIETEDGSEYFYTDQDDYQRTKRSMLSTIN